MQKTVVTTDIFHATYILTLCHCDLAVTRDARNRIVFEIGGKWAFECERVYRDGLAFVALEPFRETFYKLLNQSNQSIRPIKTDQ